MRIGLDWTDQLGPNRLKKPGAESDREQSARPDWWEPEGCWKDIPRGDIFGSKCRGSFMSIQVLMVLVSILLRTCIKVLFEHI